MAPGAFPDGRSCYYSLLQPLNGGIRVEPVRARNQGLELRFGDVFIDEVNVTVQAEAVDVTRLVP